jgi:hypothetical protein
MIHPHILPSTPGSPQWSLSLRFLQHNPVYASPLPQPRYIPRPSYSSRFYYPHNIGRGVQIMKLLIMKFSLLPCYLVPLRPKPSAYVPPSMSATKFHTHTKQQAKLRFTVNVRKSHRQPRCILQGVYEDRVLFVCTDLHVSLCGQQHAKYERAIRLVYRLFFTAFFFHQRREREEQCLPDSNAAFARVFWAP